MLELVMVVSIIMITAAVALPQMVGYVRLYRLRSAGQQIAGQLQTARAKAVMKNVNLGVVFVARQNASAWVVEDDLQPQTNPNWTSYASETFTTLLTDTTQSSGWMPLPDDIIVDLPANCPGGATANAWALRFGRLGTSCGVSSSASIASCPQPGSPGSLTQLVYVSGGNASVCLLDRRTSLRRRVTITSGGRVLTQ